MKNRHYTFENLFNVRDIGGYKTLNNFYTKERRYIKGTAKGTLKEEEKELLYNLGIRVIVDLRTKREIESTPHPLKDYKDICYYNIALTDSFEHGDREEVNSLSYLYLDLVDHAKKEFKEVFKLLAKKTKDVVYLNCTSGKDRTGVLVYLLFEVVGVSLTDIIENYSESYLNNKLRPVIGTPPASYYKFMDNNKEEMADFIKEFHKKYKSACNYLLDIGVSEKEIETIKNNLLGINN